MKYNRILVTGGAGFIGSHLIDELLKLNFEVCCIDSFDPFYDINEKKRNIASHLDYSNYILKEGDIRDKEFIDTVFAKYQPEVVIHLAAKAGVRPSVEDPHLYQKVNIEGSLNLLEASVKHQIKKFINGSSSSVYGLNESIPFNEKDVLNKIASPYAATKLAVEAFVTLITIFINYQLLTLDSLLFMVQDKDQT